MRLKDYKKSIHANLSFEIDNEHRERTKQIYQYEYPDAKFIGENGTSSKYTGGKPVYDNFIDLIKKYEDSNVKFMTMSKEFSVNKYRDAAVKEAISKGKIFLNAYGNDNTRVFNDGDENLWITAIGVNQHRYSKKWLINGYVNDDLSQVDKRYTFAVTRYQDDMPSIGWSGTSFDQPYLVQLMEKMTTYAELKGYDLHKKEILDLLYHVGQLIEVKGHEVYLIRNTIEFDKIDEFLDTLKKESDPMKIIIDPGHGGTDPGGGNNSHWKEKDFTLTISQYQYDRFKELGVNVDMTRFKDVTLGAKTRTTIVKASKSNICISNHINASGGKGSEGAETIHSIHNDGELAKEIYYGIVGQGMKGRRYFSKEGNNGDYYYMHRDTGAVQTVIVEYGFADNDRDTQKLLTHWKDYAESVVKAACKYIGHEYKEPATDTDVATKPDWKKEFDEAWIWGMETGINDGAGRESVVTEERLMVFLKRFYEHIKK